MSESNHHVEGQEPSSDRARAGLSRRDLIRAGLKAAPLVATLKTDMVLATTTGTVVRPSAFASFKANGNRCSVRPGGTTTGNVGKCLTHAQCRQYVTTTTCSFNSKYHSYAEGTSGCGFKQPLNRLSGCSVYNPKLSWIVGTSTTTYFNPQTNIDKLAFYCALAYMSAKFYGDADCFIKAQDCRDIWANSGVWKVGGVTRDLAWTLDYFQRCFGSTSFDACLTA